MRSRTQDRTDAAAMRLIIMSRQCPTNDMLAAAIGARGAAAGAAALKRLEASGQITIERSNGWRVVRETQYGSMREGPDE